MKKCRWKSEPRTSPADLRTSRAHTAQSIHRTVQPDVLAYYYGVALRSNPREYGVNPRITTWRITAPEWLTHPLSRMP